MADETSIDLLGGGFTRGMLAELEQKMVLDAFSKHVAQVEHRINDGKEATVYLCSTVPGVVKAPLCCRQGLSRQAFSELCEQCGLHRHRPDPRQAHGEGGAQRNADRA